MATVIHDSMLPGTRNYHSVQHVFNVSGGVADNPIAILTVFSMTVQYPLDWGIPDLQHQHLKIYNGAFARLWKFRRYASLG